MNEIDADLPADLSDFWPHVVAGADWETSVYMQDDNKAPEDTTGWQMEVTFAKEDGTPLKVLTVGAGIVNSPTAGRFDITLSAADTVALEVPMVKVGVKTTDAGGGIDYLFTATLPVFYPL